MCSIFCVRRRGARVSVHRPDRLSHPPPPPINRRLLLHSLIHTHSLSSFLATQPVAVVTTFPHILVTPLSPAAILPHLTDKQLERKGRCLRRGSDAQFTKHVAGSHTHRTLEQGPCSAQIPVFMCFHLQLQSPVTHSRCTTE